MNPTTEPASKGSRQAGLSREQATAILQARRQAVRTLTGYARYIDIPNVPDDGDVDDRTYKIIETPLALHHVVLLNTLQLMVDGLLVYDSQAIDSPLLFDSLRGEAPRPPEGRSGGGVAQFLEQAPSLNAPQNETHPPRNDSGLTDSVKSAIYETDGSGGGVLSPENWSKIDQKGDRWDWSTKKAVNSIILDVLSGEKDPLQARQELVPHMPGYKICRRVMVMMPPGSAKSTYATVVFPTWVMGRVKAFETLLTGWGDPICRRHGKRARQIVDSPQYRALFGTHLDPKTSAAEDWRLLNQSSYKSSGINSGVAGFRTHGLVWDDLTKNRKEADSETIRNDVWNAYIDDARSRKTPSAWEVGIGTRWHEDEIMGRILPEGYSGESGFIKCRDGNVWYVLCLAAENEQLPENDPLGRQIGEYIWPEWFTESYWDEKKVNARSWGSLYQQRPAPETGIVFQKEDFKRYSELPKGDTYIGYDPGVSAEGDDTAIQVWRVDEHARLFLIETFKRKCSMDVWIIQLLTWVKIYRPIEAVSESGVIRKAAEPFIKRAMRKAKTFFTQTWVNRSANKVAMAQGAKAMVSSGQVFVPNNSDGDRFIDACVRFPASKDDHEVDAFVNLCCRLETIWESAPVSRPEKKVVVISGEIPIKSLMPPRFSKKKSRWAHRKH